MSARVVRAWPLLLAAVGVGLLGWSAWHVIGGAPPDADPEEPEAEDEPPTDLLAGERFVKVTAHDVEVFQEFRGRVRGEGTIPVRAPLGMRVPVVKIHHEVGDFVAAGEPLVTLDEEQIHEALRQADEAGDQDAAARFRGYLDHVVLRAPVDAQVLDLFAELGDTPVDNGPALVTLADRSSWSFVVMLPEDVARHSAALGTKLSIRLEADLGTVVGTVATLGETSQGTLPTVGGYVNVVLGLEPHEGVEPELAGVVRVPTSTQTAALVPKPCVEWRGETPVVLAWEDGAIRERTLRIDGEEGDSYVVLYGVLPGESVVLPPADR